MSNTLYNNNNFKHVYLSINKQLKYTCKQVYITEISEIYTLNKFLKIFNI